LVEALIQQRSIFKAEGMNIPTVVVVIEIVIEEIDKVGKLFFKMVRVNGPFTNAKQTNKAAKDGTATYGYATGSGFYAESSRLKDQE
jgi:hypothetical protein